MSTPAKVLAVDDNDDGLFALEGVLKQQGFEVVTASNGREAISRAEASLPDLILLDVQMPGMDGFEVLRHLRADPVFRFTPIALLTAKDSLEDVLHGFEVGADDYIRKPFQQDELIARVNAMLRMRRLYRDLAETKSTNQRLQGQLAERHSFASLIGKSGSMQEIYGLIERVKDADVPVLITGESGTGKELVARAIHFEGRRREAAFVAQNCSAFSEHLLESELFGHVRGSFTGAVKDKRGLFEEANHGTFFLDEMGEMAAPLQAKLLRVLQDGTFIAVGDTKGKKVDVRLIAATNRDLQKMVKEGSFREDLFYRLHVVTIHLPPLRERRIDIPLLISHFLDRAAKKSGQQPRSLTPDATALMTGFHWPGNIRQLENEIERALIMAGPSEVLRAEHLSPQILEGSGGEERQSKRLEGRLKDALENLERNMIQSSLERSEGNKSESAKELGISRSNLIAKVKLYGLE